MAFFQKLFLLSLAPTIAFITLRQLSPELFREFEAAIQPYVVNTPLSQYLSDPPLPPSELPLLFSSVSQQSHIEKIGPIAVALAELGHPVTFISGKVFEDYVSSLHPNISFLPFHGNDDKFNEEDMKHWLSLPSGVEREIWGTQKVIVDGAPDAHNTYQAYFASFRDRYGDTKPLLSLFDCTILGHQAVYLGVPGLKPDASISISLLPLLLHSNQTFPPRLGRKPHQGPDAEEVHEKAYEAIKTDDPYEWQVSQAWWAKLKEMGSPRDDFPQMLHGMNVNADYLVTMGIPEFEFPRKNVGVDVRYFGALKKPERQGVAESDLPGWWDEVVQAQAEGKRIVVVSQGTVETKPEELIIPTLEALKDREDVLVVATFYNLEPEEVSGLVVPENARVAKYVPHDALLPLVDVMVANGGYGAVQKCLIHGVPMIIAGTSQDKATNGAIADFTGFGISLYSQSPGAEKIRSAVDKMLGDDGYRRRAKELSKAFDGYDMQSVFEKVVQDATRKWQQARRRKTEL